jgi:hypothetical protein
MNQKESFMATKKENSKRASTSTDKKSHGNNSHEDAIVSSLGRHMRQSESKESEERPNTLLENNKNNN